MRGVSILTIVALAAGIWGTACRGDEGPDADAYALSLRLSAGGDLPKYIRIARDFVQTHPDSPLAPRAAVDWLMAAKIAGDKTAVQDALHVLIFDYPKTLQAAYVTSQFANAGEFTNILQHAFDAQVDAPDPEFAGKFCLATLVGIRQFGNGVFNADPFTLKCWLAAQETGDLQLASLAASLLKDPAEDQKRVNAAVLDPSASAVLRIERLHAFPKVPVAGLLARHLLARLPADELQQPAVRRIRAVSLLRQSKWAEALAILETFDAEGRDAQWTYCRAFALFASNDVAGAQAAFDDVHSKYGSTAWAASARQLRAALPAFQESLRMQADGVRKSVAHFLSPEVDGWQMVLQWKLAKGTQFRVDLDYRERSDTIEFVICRQNLPMLAYRNDGVARTFLFPGEPAATRYHERGHLVPKFEVGLNPNGSPRFNWTINGGQSLRNTMLQRLGILSDEFLTQPAGVQNVLRGFFGGLSAMPCAAEQTPDGVRFVWLVPQADSPELLRHELHLDADGWLRSLRIDALEIRDLRYGSADSLPLAASRFPDVPIRDVSKVDPSVLMRALGAFLQLFDDQAADDAPRPAVTRKDDATSKQ